MSHGVNSEDISPIEQEFSLDLNGKENDARLSSDNSLHVIATLVCEELEVTDLCVCIDDGTIFATCRSKKPSGFLKSSIFSRLSTVFSPSQSLHEDSDVIYVFVKTESVDVDGNCIYDTPKKALISDGCLCCAWDCHDRSLYVGCSSGCIRMFKIDDDIIEQCWYIQAHSGSVIALSSAVKLPFLASIGSDRHLAILDFDSASIIKRDCISEAGLTCVEYDDINCIYFIGTILGSIIVVGHEDDRRLFRLPEFTAHKRAIRSLSFDCSRQLLFSGGDDQLLRIWLVQSSAVTCLQGEVLHLAPIMSVTWCSSLRCLITAELSGVVNTVLWEDGAVIIANCPNGHQQSEGPICARFIDEGGKHARYIISNTSYCIKIWKIN